MRLKAAHQTTSIKRLGLGPFEMKLSSIIFKNSPNMILNEIPEKTTHFKQISDPMQQLAVLREEIASP